MARETQKAKIERLEKEIEMWRELCSKMQKELSEFKELADDSYEKSSTYIQQCKRIELLEEQNEAYRLSVEHEKKMRKALVDNYEPEIERLNEEVQKLKSENKNTFILLVMSHKKNRSKIINFIKKIDKNSLISASSIKNMTYNEAK